MCVCLCLWLMGVCVCEWLPQGLPVDDKIVQHGEKQKTLSRK
jgi:hypothetical protein